MSSNWSLFNSLIWIIRYLQILTIILVIFLIFLKWVIFKVIILISLSSASNRLILKSIVWIIRVVLLLWSVHLLLIWWWKTTSISYNCPVICLEFTIPRQTHIICTANLSLFLFQIWEPLTLNLVLNSPASFTHFLSYSGNRGWVRFLTDVLLSGTDIITITWVLIVFLSMLLGR